LASSLADWSSRRLALVAATILAAASCRHAGPVATGLSPDWQFLVGEARPFAALYRLECCGQHNLLATVRAGEGALRLTVAAPPAGVVADAWLTAADGSFTRNQGRCVTPIPSRGLPLSDGRWLPLDAGAADLALSGRVAEGAQPDPAAPGWLALEVPGFSQMRWRVAGSPSLVVAVEIGKAGEDGFLQATLSEHHGRVPGRIAITAGGERASLVLVEWRSATPPEPPVWLSATPCSEAP
jgi:hypothetical protein